MMRSIVQAVCTLLVYPSKNIPQANKNYTTPAPVA